MESEQLKRESEEYADKYGKSNFDLWDTARFAYYQGAEPREKRIEELEEANNELKEQLETFRLKIEALSGDIPWSELKDKSELIKENAELKAFKEKCRFNVSDICKDIETENNLNKAKKLLNMFLRLHYKPIVDESTLYHKVEQFIKDSEVKE